jgi:hypothetical protein
MKLLGAWNWYLPSWLAWLPDVHVEGAATRRGGKPDAWSTRAAREES